MNRYRIIHFTPDPFSSGRVPIGAIIDGEQGISVVPATRLPDLNCLGGRSKVGIMRILLQDLNQINNFDSLPPSLGPHASLDDIRYLPSNTVNIEQWIKRYILPVKIKAEEEQEKTSDRSSKRATVGYRCLETYRVAKYVRKTFRPQDDGQELFSSGAHILDIISHWVANIEELMLLEPIVPETLSHHVNDDSKVVAKRFLEYKQLIKQTVSKKNATLSAYLLPGIDKEHKRRAIENLKISADRIYDLEKEQDRANFINRIRSLGEDPNRGQLSFAH